MKIRLSSTSKLVAVSVDSWPDVLVKVARKLNSAYGGAINSRRSEDHWSSTEREVVSKTCWLMLTTSQFLSQEEQALLKDVSSLLWHYSLTTECSKTVQEESQRRDQAPWDNLLYQFFTLLIQGKLPSWNLISINLMILTTFKINRGINFKSL